MASYGTCHLNLLVYCSLYFRPSYIDPQQWLLWNDEDSLHRQLPTFRLYALILLALRRIKASNRCWQDKFLVNSCLQRESSSFHDYRSNSELSSYIHLHTNRVDLWQNFWINLPFSISVYSPGRVLRGAVSLDTVRFASFIALSGSTYKVVLTVLKKRFKNLVSKEHCSCWSAYSQDMYKNYTAVTLRTGTCT